MISLSSLFSWFKPVPSLDPDTQEGLRRVAERVGKTLAMLPGFDRKLAAPVAHAREYCNSLVDALPLPLDIDRRSFVFDPLVHALFASADDIGAMLAASAPIRAWLDKSHSRESDSFIALMAARRMEKQGFGVALQGEICASDVPQSLLQFANQMVMLPAANLEEAHEAFRMAAFDSLLSTFVEHLEQVQETYKTLKTERELERVRQRGHLEEQAIFPPRHIAELDKRLQQQFQSMRPEAIIDELASFLMHPEKALSLEPVQLWVTRGGVLQDGKEGEMEAALIGFMEFQSRDRRRHVVLPVRIRCDEAREALKKACKARENMLLI